MYMRLLIILSDDPKNRKKRRPKCSIACFSQKQNYDRNHYLSKCVYLYTKYDIHARMYRKGVGIII